MLKKAIQYHKKYYYYIIIIFKLNNIIYMAIGSFSFFYRVFKTANNNNIIIV